MNNKSLLAAALVLTCATDTYALNPEQVAVIVNGRSLESQKVGKYYMQARGIPQDNLIIITVEPKENIGERYYRSQIVEPIRKALVERKLDRTVTCLATTYDVPLKIERQAPTPTEDLEINALRKAMVEGIQNLQKLEEQYSQLAPPPPATTEAATQSAAATREAPTTNTNMASAAKTELPTLPKVIETLQSAMQKAGQRLGTVEPAERNAAVATFLNLQQDAGGLMASVATLKVLLNQQQQQLQRDPFNESIKATIESTRQTIDQFQQQIRQNDTRINELAKQKPSIAGRRETQNLRKTNTGLVGMLRQVELDLTELQHDQSDANMESELMMLWEDDYTKARWEINPYCLPVYASIRDKSQLPRLMMATRLDGISGDAVIRMIDNTLNVEKAGLEGTAYFDARGLNGTDAYSQYDSDIRAAAKYMKDNTHMNVVLNDQAALFDAKDAPNAALYCGWYSVHNYQNTVQWLTGCVGYHIASFEMVSLHTPGEKGWVPNMLANDVCGTLGPVEEPYLTSFPRPSLFFPLLVSGKFTQAEVYFVTVPWISWRVGYVGDPLYNPFKNKPQLTTAQLQMHPVLRQAKNVFPGSW